MKISKTKQKIAIKVLTLLLSIPLGGIAGFILGLLSISFIPTCQTAHGLQSCFTFNGLVGYEASGEFGFYAGLIITPIIYIGTLIYSRGLTKNNE